MNTIRFSFRRISGEKNVNLRKNLPIAKPFSRLLLVEQSLRNKKHYSYKFHGVVKLTCTIMKLLNLSSFSCDIFNDFYIGRYNAIW